MSLTLSLLAVSFLASALALLIVMMIVSSVVEAVIEKRDPYVTFWFIYAACVLDFLLWWWFWQILNH